CCLVRCLRGPEILLAMSHPDCWFVASLVSIVSAELGSSWSGASESDLFCGKRSDTDASSRTRTCRSKAGDEGGVFRGCYPLLHDRQDACLVAAHQGRRVQPQAGEDPAAQQPVGIGCQTLVALAAADKPVHLLVEHPPDDVLAHARAVVDL